MTTQIDNYAESVSRMVNYNDKNGAVQQELMNGFVSQTFEGVAIADGVELTSGPVIAAMQMVIGGFKDDDKEKKNRAMSIMRVQLQRAFKTLIPEDSALRVGLKAATKTKKDRILVTAKDEKKDPTLASQIKALIDSYGKEAVVAEVVKQTK